MHSLFSHEATAFCQLHYLVFFWVHLMKKINMIHWHLQGDPDIFTAQENKYSWQTQKHKKFAYTIKESHLYMWKVFNRQTATMPAYDAKDNWLHVNLIIFLVLSTLWCLNVTEIAYLQ